MRASSRRFHRSRGLTLVEVVAGLALLAALAVGVLLTISAHRRQAQLAHDRLAAADLADQLLAGWYSSGQGIPRSASGVFSADGKWYWTTRVIDWTFLETSAVEVIRLHVSQRSSRERPLITIDLLSPVPKPEGVAPL